MSEIQRFTKKPHLTKNQGLPICYKEVEKIISAVKAHKGSVKTILHNSRLHRSIFKKVYALTINVLKHRRLLEKILEDVELLKKEPYLRLDCACILIYELIFKKSLPGSSKPVETILNYKHDIEKAYSKCIENGYSANVDLTTLPKYVRINSLLTNVKDVIKDLEECQFEQIIYNDTSTLEEFYELVKTLDKGCFVIDYHFKDILVFSGKENLFSWPLYQNGQVFIQDKSSYIPIHVLNPQPGSVVLDACAAPGMKTLHIAAKMNNKGIIYALEKDNKRFEVLKNNLQAGGVKTCKQFCKDFSSTDPQDVKFSNVEYILVDPSCSGSGMVSRMDEVTDSKDSKDALRIGNLARFQILLLKHALKFPFVKRVVYCTCSLNEEENEYVVHEVLNSFSRSFKLCEAFPNWDTRGSDKFEFGSLCLRTYPDKHLTNGFFVALFERIPTVIDPDVCCKKRKFNSNKSDTLSHLPHSHKNELTDIVKDNRNIKSIASDSRSIKKVKKHSKIQERKKDFGWKEKRSANDSTLI